MAIQLKPGNMGSAEDTGTPSAFANSMAGEIERQLVDLLKAEGLPAPKTDDNSRESRERRLLFVAIARGIVKHLDVTRLAITVTLPSGGGTTSPLFDIEGKDW